MMAPIQFMKCCHPPTCLVSFQVRPHPTALKPEITRFKNQRSRMPIMAVSSAVDQVRRSSGSRRRCGTRCHDGLHDLREEGLETGKLGRRSERAELEEDAVEAL